MENKFNIDFDKSTHKIGSGIVSVPLTVLAGKFGVFIYKKIVIKVVEKKLTK